MYIDRLVKEGMIMGVKNFEFQVEAKTDNLDEVMNFVGTHLDEIDCPFKVRMQIDIAVEEIFVNIASYAYSPGSGDATIKLEIDDDPELVKIIFIDSGVPYDPLKKRDPDITLSADERAIGGLGIFMVKKSMDDMFYEYKDEQNMLTIIKKLN